MLRILVIIILIVVGLLSLPSSPPIDCEKITEAKPYWKGQAALHPKEDALELTKLECRIQQQ